MEIKAADDKQRDIDALEALLARPGVTADTQHRIQDELRLIRSGVQAERDAAYEIEFHFGNSHNQMTLHDLRLESRGRVAQIDHLIITRLFQVWVCESKSFADGVRINAHGEWERFYGRRAYGIPSPIEQNRRHLLVLGDVFKDAVRLPRRVGFTLVPELKSLVIISNRGRIVRPPPGTRIDGLDTVIKAEALEHVVRGAIDKAGPTVFAKIVLSRTIEDLARQLAALHRPIAIDWAARFGLPATPQAQPPAPPAAMQVDREPQPVRAGAERVAQGKGPRSLATCESCGRTVSRGVARYSRDHADRFGGRILCMDCQRQVGGPVA